MPEAQWLAHAAKVEQEANHEVNRLASLLDLNSAQQDQLFAMLARRSTSWLPGMTTNQGSLGSVTTATEATVASADDELVAYLNADQQQTLIQEEMDRQAWWEEMLPQLLPPQLDGTTGTETLTPSTGSDAPETKPYEGGEMLLED